MKRKFCKLNDHGAALIAGLLILVVLSILGITTMQSSLLQERMAGNMEQRDNAFQIAEAGLRDGETWLSDPTIVVLPSFDSTGGETGWLYDPSDSTLWGTAATWDNAQDGVLDSQYFVEFMADVDAGGSDSIKFGALPEDFPGMYRVTSRGISPNGRSAVILQSTFIR